MTTILRVGENTAEAARQAALAKVQADAAEVQANAAATSATAATTAANVAAALGRYKTTLAAGVSAYAVGEMFSSDEGGTLAIYKRTGTAPFYQYVDDVLLGGTTKGRLIESSIGNTTAIAGRTGTNAAANLVVTNALIAAAVGRDVYVPSGDWVVSANPTNPTGKRLVGPGNLLVQDAVAGTYQQLNTYADQAVVIGREYLTRVYARIANGPGGGTAQLKVFGYGDSTMAGYVAPPATRNGYFLPEYIIPRLLAQQGIHNVSFTNQGVSGTSWPDISALSDLSAATDLFIIKYGINDAALVPTDPVANKIATLATNMDAKLSAIRASTYGDIEELSILLVGPNATLDQPNGRNEEWYEEVRRVYVAMARKYGCAYFDTYAYLRDARLAGGLWLDTATVSGATAHIHPLDAAAQWIWGGLVRNVFPHEEHSFWAANNFTVRGLQAGAASLTKLPSDYVNGTYGETWEFAQVADGFPGDGILKTSLNPDGFAVQELWPLATYRRKFTRFADNATTWDPVWTGAAVALTLANGWVTAATGGSGDAPPIAVRDDNGIVTVCGSIKSGTTAAFTLIATLPAGYRPAGYQYASCPTAAGGSCQVRCDPDGSIYLLTTGDATRTTFSIQFFGL